MTPLKRLVATSTLVVSLSGAALAGDTMTPPAAATYTPVECTMDCSGPAASTPAQPAEDSWVAIVTEATKFANWVAMSIL